MTKFRKILIGSMAVLAGPAMLAFGDTKDDLQQAAKKLGEADNYSWTTKIEADGPAASSTLGKTQKDGLTWLSIARQDNVMEAVFQGEKGAVKTANGWEALPEPGQGRGGQGGGGGGGAPGAAGGPAAGGGGGQGGGRNPAMMMSRMIRNYKAPAAQAAELISRGQDYKQDGDVVTAALSEDAAKNLLSMGGGRGGRRGGGNGGGGGQGGGGQGGGAQGGGGPPEVKDAKGDLKFWTKDGVITKYQSHVQGTVTMQGEDRQIDRTTTVEIKDVGTSKIEVPDEAKKAAGISS